MLSISSSFFFLLFIYSSISILQISNGSQEITKTIVVDPKRNGFFWKIQDAIDSIPDYNQQWVKIHISTGIFDEKINIAAKKGFIIMEGEGAQNTIIQWGDHVYISGFKMDGGRDVPTTWETATFVSQAHNIILSGLTIKNTYLNRTKVEIGVAALLAGDKTYVYACNFIGVQDTLSDLRGRHYFKNCYVEGAVDFIFGFGQSIYEGCSLSTVPTSLGVGFVTAQGASDANDKSGFVFKNCTLEGNGTTYLGRSWRSYARVLFYQTYMQNIVVPEGWQSWNAANGGIDTTFAEHGCSGPGSDTSRRVPWAKKLSDEQVRQLTDISYINDGWLEQQPAGFGL